MEDGAVHPMRVKMDLAQKIITDFHSAEDAKKAEEAFQQVFSKKEMPDEMPEHEITVSDEPIRLTQLMLDTATVTSRGEANRLIKQNAVAIDETKVAVDREIDRTQPQTFVLRVGKRRFVRIKVG
jgi:tyrosyl-tRNA synthetase